MALIGDENKPHSLGFYGVSKGLRVLGIVSKITGQANKRRAEP
jgi:hypothetical protein